MNTSAKLTKREHEIAELLSYGFAKKEIALVLFVSPRTVENIARNIYDKLEINSVAQLSAWHFHKKHNVSFDRYNELRTIYSPDLYSVRNKKRKDGNFQMA